MKIKTLILTSFSISTLAGVAFAGAHGAHGARFFEKLDTNRDGQITPVEMKIAAADRITAADTNGDGAASPEEMKAHFQSKMQERKGEHFAKKDANGDGVLSRDELARMPEAVFTRLDTDKSGTLSKEELAAGRGAFRGKAGKAPGDTKAGRHGGRHGGPGAHMTRADQNGDGKVDVKEAEAMAEKHFQRLDKNADGVVTRDEMSVGKGRRGQPGARGKRGAAAPDAAE